MASVPIQPVDTQRIADAAFFLEFLERTNQSIKLETNDNAIALQCNRGSITREINRIKERYPNLWNIKATEMESPETTRNRRENVAAKEYEKWKEEKEKRRTNKKRKKRHQRRSLDDDDDGSDLRDDTLPGPSTSTSANTSPTDDSPVKPDVQWLKGQPDAVEQHQHQHQQQQRPQANHSEPPK